MCRKVRYPLRVYLTLEYAGKLKFKHCSCLFIISMNSASLGSALLSFVWFEVAKGIIKRASDIYGLTEEQVGALHTVFLKPNDFRVSYFE